MEDNPIVELLGGIALAGVAAAILAAGVLIVSIAMTEKAPAVAKRVIRKI